MRYLLLLILVASPAMAQDSGLELWEKIYAVFSHPRCANCHVGPDNLPMWSGNSYWPTPRPHGMNIDAGASPEVGLGRNGAGYIACSSCHTQRNSELPHGPPGAHDAKGEPTWELAPVEMQWFDKSSAEVCAQIKDPHRADPAHTGKFDSIAKVAKHIATDDSGLVHWAWNPGPGRGAAPYSAAEVVDFLEQWEAARAPCPPK